MAQKQIKSFTLSPAAVQFLERVSAREGRSLSDTLDRLLTTAGEVTKNQLEGRALRVAIGAQAVTTGALVLFTTLPTIATLLA